MLPFWPGYDWLSLVIRGQIVFLYGGGYGEMGKNAMDYILVIFRFNHRRTWSVGMFSKKNGLELA